MLIPSPTSLVPHFFLSPKSTCRPTKLSRAQEVRPIHARHGTHFRFPLVPPVGATTEKERASRDKDGERGRERGAQRKAPISYTFSYSSALLKGNALHRKKRKHNPPPLPQGKRNTEERANGIERCNVLVMAFFLAPASCSVETLPSVVP